MNIKDYRVLSVFGAPLLGINHLSNMISTSPHVSPRIQVPNYKDYVIKHYQNLSNSTTSMKVHLETFLNVGIEDYTKAQKLVESNTLTTILPGHVEDAFWVLPKLSHLGKLSVITFELFDPTVLDILPPQRRRMFNDYNPFLYRFLYTKDVVCRLFDLPPDDVFAVDLSSYLIPDVSWLLTGINDIYALDLDISFCMDLHKLWFADLTKK